MIVGNADDLSIFVQAARHTVSLKGDYLEFGVYAGASFCAAYFALSEASARLKGKHKSFHPEYRLFAFDSFEGLPEIESIDKKGPFRKGDYSCTEHKFIDTLNEQGLDLERVVIVKGFYNNTLNDELRIKHNLRSARIIHIDCDLYESAKQVLEFATPIIQEGTIIIFDDWFQFHGNPDRGEARAFREWLDKNNQFHAVEFMRRPPWSNSFILSYKLDA